jgi:hypothetical protein
VYWRMLWRARMSSQVCMSQLHRAARHLTPADHVLRKNGPAPVPRQPSDANPLAPSAVIPAKGAHQSCINGRSWRLPDPQGGIR